MFKSRKLGVDAAHVRPRGLGNSGVGGNKVSITTMPGAARRPRVPDEYRTLQHGGSRRGRFMALFVALVGLCIAGFYYWTTVQPKVIGDSVTLAVTAPASVSAGDEVIYTVEYTNIDRVAIESIELDVQWPEGFYFNKSSTNPTGDEATTWKLGPLEPGQTGSLMIYGQLVGSKGNALVSIFRLSYRPVNISSDFEVSKDVSVAIADAKLDLKLVSPEKVLAGSDGIIFEALVDNLTDTALEGVDIEVIPPKDFDVVSYDPVLTENHWKGSLGGDPLRLKLTANVASDAEGSEVWIVEVNQDVGGTLRRLLRQELTVAIVRPDFTIDVKVNGENDSFDAEYGDTLNYQAKIVNKSSAAIGDLKITALLDSDVIDRTTVTADGLVSNKGITWTKEHADALGLMQPGQEILLSWKAQLLPQGTIGRASVDSLMTVEIEGLPGWHQNSPVLVVTVGEGLVFNQGLYWELGGQTVGSGNLPPVTNERSVYLAVWSIDSGSQDYDSVTIYTYLPDKVSFEQEEEVDEGSLNYDEGTRRLEWQINNFSTKLLPLKATFYVKLVPTDEDKGTAMTVLNPATIVASGKEIFEAKSFSVTTARVVTTKEGDVGTVVE